MLAILLFLLSWNKRKEAKEKFKAVTKKLKNACVPLKSSNSHFIRNSRLKPHLTTNFVFQTLSVSMLKQWRLLNAALRRFSSRFFFNAFGLPHLGLDSVFLNLTIFAENRVRGGPNSYPGSVGKCALDRDEEKSSGLFDSPQDGEQNKVQWTFR